LIDAATPAQTNIENIAEIPAEELSDNAITLVEEEEPDIIEMLKQVDSTAASIGSIITYTLYITNIYSESISDIDVWDFVPDYTTYVPGSATAGGVFDDIENRVVWDWSFGMIAPGHSIDLSFKVLINLDAPEGHLIENIGYGAAELPGIIAAKALSNGDVDTVQSNPVVTIVNIPTSPEDNPTIFKEVSASVATPGTDLIYTITVTNPDPGTINALIITDNIPANTAYNVGSASDGGLYDPINNRLTWIIGPLAEGQSEQMTFEANIDVNALDSTIITNQANIVAPVPVIGNQTQTTVVRDRFVVTKAVDRSEISLTDTVTYTIGYLNGTSFDQDNVIVSDTLSDDLVLIAGSPTNGGVYNTDTRTITWDLGTVAGNGSGILTFRATPAETVENNQVVENSAVADGDNFAPVVSEPVFVIIRFPDVSLTKMVNPSISGVGEIVTYTVNATNTGSGLLSNAVLIDDLPEGFSYVSGTATVNGSSVNVTGTDTLNIPVGDLNESESVEIIYQAEIAFGLDKTLIYTNSALLRGLNNSGQTVEFGPAHADVSLQTPQLEVSIKAGVPSGTAGSLIPFTIEVKNNSNALLSNVSVSNIIPEVFFYIEGSTIIDGSVAPDPQETDFHQIRLSLEPHQVPD
jgi:uncharacterized repeat protein (TIGR01451 family)